jgi:hypothetical protein
VPLQQRSVALQLIDARRQIEPPGLQAWPVSQRPRVAPGALLQWTFAAWPAPPSSLMEPADPGDPQQSASVAQSSPVGRQPLGGWQMKTPVAAKGRHERLQQSPPQDGSGPPLYIAPPLQTWPAGVQLAVLAMVRAHTPTTAPEAFMQSPPQQSRSPAHASPICLQNDGVEQIPWAQYFEQHSLPAAQGLPDVLQTALSGAQAPLVHRPPQHSPSALHFWPSATQPPEPHFPFIQLTLQHSGPAEHVAPAGKHWPPP